MPALLRSSKPTATTATAPKKQKGDRRFDQLVLPVSKPDTLIEIKDILVQFNFGEMPPKKSKQPSAEETKAFVDQMTQALTGGREKLASTASTTVLRRLNRTEYLHTIGDLFSLNMAAFDPTSKFPRDQSAEHMENLGDVLQTSGYLLDQCLDAADAVVEKVFTQQKPVKEQAWHFTKNFRTKLKKKEKDYNNAHLLVEECIDSDKHTGYGVINDFVDGVPADGFYEVLTINRAHIRPTMNDKPIENQEAPVKTPNDPLIGFKAKTGPYPGARS